MNRFLLVLRYTALVFALFLVCGLGLTGCWENWGDDGTDDDDTGDDDTGDDDTGDDDTGDDDTGDDDTSTDCPDDSFEENDSIPTAASIAPGVFASLVVCPGDNDYFTLTVQPGHMLVVRATFTHADGDIDITVTDPDGLTFSGVSTDDNEEVSTEASTGTGIFTLAVELYDDGSDAVPGNTYSLELTTEPYVGDDDDTGDDDDSMACLGPSNIAGAVTLTDTLGNPTPFFSVDQPLVVNVQVQHQGGANWPSPYPTECLFNFKLENPNVPPMNPPNVDSQVFTRSCNFNFGFWCTTPQTTPADPCELECLAAPFTDSFTIAPLSAFEFDPPVTGTPVPLPSAMYNLHVELDPIGQGWNTGITNQTFNVFVREGARAEECNDGNDNDVDGQVDCDDVDCAGKDGCPP